MPKYAALIRGINVGGKKKLAMGDLRDLLSGLGYTDVRTHLQSGNAVFACAPARPEELSRQIERGIERKLGLSVRCLIRSGSEMHAVIDGNPLRAIATDGSKLMALFLSHAPDITLLAIHDPTALAPDEISLGDRVIYQWCPNGVSEAPNVSGFVQKHLKVAVTARSWNTVTKLSELLDG